MSFLYLLAMLLLAWPCRLFFPMKILGRRRLPKKRLLVISNHRSAGDPLFVAARFWDRQFRFLAKKELFKNRFVGWIIRSAGTLAVSRGENDLALMRDVGKLLNKEKTVLLFPEGTRNKTQDDFLEMKNGAALFSLKYGAPIVPMYIAQKQRFFRRNYMYIGEPFDFKELEGERLNKETLAKAGEKIAEKFAEVKNKLDEYLENKRNKNRKKKNKNKEEKLNIEY